MCKSFDVSLITGIFSYAISYYLYRRNIGYDRGIAIFIFAFSTIQWLEAFLWYDLSNRSLNRIITALIPIVLGLELIASLYAASLYFPISMIEYVVYIVAFIALNFMWWRSSHGYTSIDSQTGSLLWGNMKKSPSWSRYIFLILLIWPLLRLARYSWSVLLIVIMAVITFFYSFGFGETFASNWCWIANFSSLIQLFSPLL